MGLPALPLEMKGRKFGLRRDLPAPGADSMELLREAGYSEDEIQEMLSTDVVRTG